MKISLLIKNNYMDASEKNVISIITDSIKSITDAQKILDDNIKNTIDLINTISTNSNNLSSKKDFHIKMDNDLTEVLLILTEMYNNCPFSDTHVIPACISSAISMICDAQNHLKYFQSRI